MNLTGVWGVFSLTFKESMKTKWLILFSLVFFLLSVNIPSVVSQAAQGDILGTQNIVTFASTLVALVFPIVPLLSLPMGATSIVDDRESGTLQYVLSNPVSKSEYFVGKAGGLVLSTSIAVLLGFGAAAFVAFTTDFSKYSSILWLIAFAVLLNMAMLSLGFIISNFSRRKVTALVLGIFAWLLYTGLADVDNLAIILNLRFGELGAVALLLADPVGQARILTGLQIGVCGAFSMAQCGNLGLFAFAYFHSNMYSAVLLAMISWIAAFFIIGFLVFRRQDLS